jgi:hypothetical protein
MAILFAVTEMQGHETAALSRRADAISLRFAGQGSVSGLQESTKEPLQDEPVDESAEDAQRRRVLPVVDHACAARDTFEPVLVPKPGEGSLDLFVNETERWLEGRDAARQTPLQSEMACPPGNSLAWSDQTTCPSRNGPLMAAPHRLLVEVDVSRQVEDTLDCGSDLGLEIDPYHLIPLSTQLDASRLRWEQISIA